MTVLELDRSLAQTPPPMPRQALRELPPRGATEDTVAGRPPKTSGPETAAQAAARLAETYVPQGVTASEAVPVELRYRGLGGHQRLAGSGRVFAGRPGGDPCAAVLVMADPLVLLTVRRTGNTTTAWALVPGGPSVTARADALRLVRALRVDGDLVVRAGDDLKWPPLELPGADTWTSADEAEWQLFEDLATLEEWSGDSIPVPRELSGEEVAHVAQAAVWVRTERIEASLVGPLTFNVTDERDSRGVDELRLHQDFGVVVGGCDIPLGTGEVQIPVEVTSAEGPDTQGLTTVTARARQQQIVFVLKPSPRRRLPARRTQPPAPRPGGPPASEHALALPVVVPASRSVGAVLRDVADRPVVSAASSAALLDELRGEGA